MCQPIDRECHVPPGTRAAQREAGSFWRKCGWLLALLIMAGAQSLPARADAPAGKILFVHGQVDVRQSEHDHWQTAGPGTLLQPGSTVRVGENGQAGLMLNDESLVRLHHNSVLTVVRAAKPGASAPTLAVLADWSQYALRRGTLWMRNNLPGAVVRIDTPNAILGIRGTEVAVNLSEDQPATHVVVLEGQVSARNQHGQASAGPGEQLVAPAGQSPRRELLLSPANSVQWTLRIPVLTPTGELSPAVASAYQHLLVGQVTQAQALLTAHLTSQSSDYVGWSLLAVSNLMLDDLAGAQASAQQAVALAPGNPMGWLASAYVAQAQHDLALAQRHFNQVLALAPDALEARLGRAEIYFGSEQNEQAWSDMELAYQQAPQDGRVNSLRGYLLLAKGDLQGAQSAFEAALARSPGLSDAWLGKAIASMRLGLNDAAFEAVSAAVLSEPRRSLLLTYWARMLYQAGRLDRALTVLDSAIRADRNDPTGWFVKAYILRDLRRYNEAFDAMRQAIALNDNRAVYRSRYLLDRDLAFKSTSLASLFSDLGLAAWAEKKALESIKQDYLNFSGHLFYAGALLNREGRSRAAASEQILSLLLQPASINTFNSFSDYTTFYEQPGLHGQVTGSLGQPGRRSGNVSAYGSLPDQQLAYQLYAGNTSEDGWRSDQQQNSYGRAATVKWQATEKDNVTVSLRRVASGGLGQAGRRGEYDSPTRNDEHFDYQQGFLDIGHHHRIDSDASLLTLFSATRFDSHDRGRQVFPFGDGIDVEELRVGQNPQSAQQLQLQYMSRFGKNQLITGLLLYRGNKVTRTRYDYAALIDGGYYPLPDDSRLTAASADERYQSIYAQGIWQWSAQVGLDYGLYLERIQRANLFTGGRVDQTELTPRLGLIWRLDPTQTVRLARFKYMVPLPFRRLDPGEVAGIPISRNSYQGTLASETSVAYEREWATGLFSANFFDSSSRTREGYADAQGRQTTLEDDATLRGLETEFNWLAGANLSLTGRYRGLQVRNSAYPDLDRREQLLSLAVQWIHPSGVRLGMSQTQRRIRFDGSRGPENISLTDASLGYELPHKRGYLGLDVRNMFNRRFNWVVDPFVSAVRVPARELALSLTLNY